MARKLKSDKVLFTATVLLVFFGVVMVYARRPCWPCSAMATRIVFLQKQAMWAAFGLVGLAVVMHVDYRTYRQPAFIWSSLAVAVAALVLVLFSAPVNSARRWFSIGGLGIQPSRLAKLSVIFFVAWFLERRMNRVNEFRTCAPSHRRGRHALVLLILVEPDFGTSVTVAIIAAVMVFAAGLNFSYLAVVRAGGSRNGVPRHHEPLPLPSLDDVREPLGRPAWRRLPDHPVAHRHRHR